MRRTTPSAAPHAGNAGPGILDIASWLAGCRKDVRSASAQRNGERLQDPRRQSCIEYTPREITHRLYLFPAFASIHLLEPQFTQRTIATPKIVCLIRRKNSASTEDATNPIRQVRHDRGGSPRRRVATKRRPPAGPTGRPESVAALQSPATTRLDQRRGHLGEGRPDDVIRIVRPQPTRDTTATTRGSSPRARQRWSITLERESSTPPTELRVKAF